MVSPHLRITLPYAQNGVLTEGAVGLGAYQSFAINSAFDPDFSGGGLQPLGFDQYAQFYGRYRVLSCKVEVTFANRSATDQILVGMYATPQSTLPAVATAWRIQPMPACRSATLSGTNGGPAVRVMRASVDLPNVLGLTRREFQTDMDFAALFSASPARVAYLHIWTQAMLSNVAAVTWAVKLYFDVEFSQAVSLSLS